MYQRKTQKEKHKGNRKEAEKWKDLPGKDAFL